MKDTLVFRYRDNFLADGTRTNQVVRKLTKNKAGHDWRGSMLILKFKGLHIEYNPSYQDIRAKDMVDIVDFFLYYGNRGI